MQKIIMLMLLTFICSSGCVRQKADTEAPVSNTASEQSVVQTSTAGDGLAAPLALPQQWRMEPGLLRGQLEGWARTAGYQVVWKVSRDYHMQTAATFNGTFVEALQQLFAGMQKMGNSFKITVYHGNFVVVVSEE